MPEDGALIVSREIAGSGGRGGARINGRSVPLSVLQELGELLVDVHGQSEHMALLRAREQLDYLDRYAGVLSERATVARLVRELRATRQAHAKLVAEERETARLQDMLRHEVAEIDSANLRRRTRRLSCSCSGRGSSTSNGSGRRRCPRTRR